MHYLKSILFITCILSAITSLDAQRTRAVRKQLYCKKCQNSLRDLQNEEPKIDEAELLDNLLTACEAEQRNPVLQNKIKCTSMAELLYVMSSYPNLCTLVGLCDDTRENSVLPFNFDPKIPTCDIERCAGMVADCGHKCACTKECSPECMQCFESTASICDACTRG